MLHTTAHLMTSTFSPLPHTSNTRQARCRRCHIKLLPGQGQGWKFFSHSLTNSPVVYLCPTCTKDQAREEKALESSAVSMETIGRALQFSAPLGFIDRELVERAVRRAGDKAPAIAAELAARIELGESFTVYQIVHIFQGA